MSLVKDYFTKTNEWIKNYGENTVVFMQVGAFFEVYGLQEENGDLTGSRITDVCAICDLAIANKSSPNGSEKQAIKMAGFRDHQLDKYLKRMNEANWTCVVYTQDAATKNTTRSLHGVFSPGTFFNDETNVVSNNTMTIWLEKSGNSSSLRMNGKTFIGIAVADIFTGRTYIAEYEADDKHNPSTYDELERNVSIYNPAEIIFITSFDVNKSKEIVQFTGMDLNKVRFIFIDEEDSKTKTKGKEKGTEKNSLSEKAKKCQKQSYQLETLRTFFTNTCSISGQQSQTIENSGNIENVFYDLQSNMYGLQAMIFLLNYLYSHNPNLANKIELPISQFHTNRLILANHSLKQLNMICDHQQGQTNTTKLASVSSLLNSSITACGKRLFISQLNNPVSDEEYLQRQYDITEYFLKNENWQIIRDGLKEVKDIEKLNRKLILKRFSPRDFCLVYRSLTSIDHLLTELKHNKLWTTLEAYLKQCGVNDFNCKNITDFIETIIDPEEAYLLENSSFNQYSAECVNKGTCFVKPGNYEELDSTCNGGLIWQQQIASIIDYLDSLIAKTETKAKNKLVKLHETPTMPPSILLTKKRSSILKLELQKIKKKQIKLCAGTNAEFMFDIELIKIENASSKTDDIVSSPQILDFTYKIRNIKDSFNELLTSVFKNICQRMTEYSSELIQIADFVRYVDLVQSRCYIAYRYDYCKPEISNVKSNSIGSFVRAHGLRHPLIEYIQNSEIYVTNDVSLGIDSNHYNDTTELGILLYGTNAVGKTSLIKALGISVIMAQAGLYVPCSKFVYYPYKAIFTRILGNDNIHRGLSTFAVEMIELRTILKLADNRSLILGDELCSGTESDSALSIFTAGIEHLHKVGSNFIFATHFHEIVDYDEIKSLKHVKAKHMTVVYNREIDALVYDRKLKDGPGNSMYGLEVCKALDLPQTFLERAHMIRNKYNCQTKADVDMTTSHFNSKKIMGRCEICDDKGVEVHHLQHQKNANQKNRIKHFNKNHIANLITLCEKCHEDFHQTDTEFERKKTTAGYKLFPIL